MTGENHSPNGTKNRQRSKSLEAVSSEQYVNSAFSSDEIIHSRPSSKVYSQVNLSGAGSIQNVNKTEPELVVSVIKIDEGNPADDDPGGPPDDAKKFANSSCANSRLSLISDIFTKTSWRERNAGWLTILCQMGLPFLIAGLGMVMAGVLLENAMTWQVFEEVSELVILVTPLLGLKGDLEMTLASRLSTHANVGNMDIPGNTWKICFGNLCLDQLQAIVCGLVASFIAIFIGAVFDQKLNSDHIVLLCSASMITASMVSIFLGSTMVGVILLSKKYNINPDNIATPVAGSMGDLVTLGMLSFFAKFIWASMKETEGVSWVPIAIFGVYICVLPACLVITHRNEFTREVLITGWFPVIVSVIISTGGGVLLDLAGDQYDGVGLYQPLINGIGGNLVSVQSSRISTALHKDCEKGVLPKNGKICESPWSVFFSSDSHAMSARLLLFMSIPGHLIFTAAAHFINGEGDNNYGPLFVFVFICAALIQVALLLYIAKILTNLCWKRQVDPDTSSIPYLTALGDLFGSGLLFIAFEFLKRIGN